MSPPRGVSISLFLADGSPTGLWIVEKSNWTGIALMWPRAVHGEARQRPELDRPGVYVLVGESDVSGTQRVYVGEADVLRKRLDQQQATRDFWTRAVAFTTKDASLNKAHVKFLESRLVELGHEAGRDEIENGNVPQRPSLSEAETAHMEAFLDEMLVIYPVLDVRAFQRLEPRAVDRLLRVIGPGAHGTGGERPEGFLVHSGSTARRTTVPSIPSWLANLRTQLLEAGVLMDDGSAIRFTTDYLFSSPTSAAAVLLGRNANGRIEWKDESGKTLKQIQSDSVEMS
jgi:hypothetical protein